MKKYIKILGFSALIFCVTNVASAQPAQTGGAGTSDVPAQTGGAGTSDTPAQTGGAGTSDTPAQTGGVDSSNSFFLQNPLQVDSIGEFVMTALEVFTYLVVLAAVLMLIYVGLRFVLAMGNTEEITKRKSQLLWIVIGIALVIGARIIVAVVINTLEATGTVSPGVINSANDALRSN